MRFDKVGIGEPVRLDNLFVGDSAEYEVAVPLATEPLAEAFVTVRVRIANVKGQYVSLEAAVQAQGVRVKRV